MPFYLHLLFNPSLRKTPLKNQGQGKAALYNLGYVQRVKQGQAIAQMRPLPPKGAAKNIDARFIVQEPIFPMGPNTYVSQNAPTVLFAATDGHVFYDGTNICVHTNLHVRSDVSFQTGNILFNGDTAIHGNVRAGFTVQGKNVLIEGMVEGGRVRATKDLVVRGGVRGVHTQKNHKEHKSTASVLVANNNIRVGFAENVHMQAGTNIIVEKNCLHANLYAGANALIRGHLWGGQMHCLQGVMITGNAGNKAGVSTRIYLGYDPAKMRKVAYIDEQLDIINDKLHHLNAVAGHLPPGSTEASIKLYTARKKQHGLMRARRYLWEGIAPHNEFVQHCKVVILGQVFSGVEIAIGTAFLYIDEPCANVVFSLMDGTIVCSPYKEKNTA